MSGKIKNAEIVDLSKNYGPIGLKAVIAAASQSAPKPKQDDGRDERRQVGGFDPADLWSGRDSD
ncbi:hypothetical protein ACU8V1_26025 (plasmid) [Rhizobium leguminosarum]